MVCSVVALVLLCGHGQGDALGDVEPAKKVSYSTVAARLENFMPDLAKVAGVPLLPDLETKDEVLLIQAENMPLKDLMAKIAEVAGAEWIHKKDGYHLGRSIELRQKEEADEHARLTALVRAADERIAKELHGRKLWDQAQADRFVRQYRDLIQDLIGNHGNRDDLLRELERMGKAGPLEKVAERVLLSLDPSVPASIRHGERIVLSSSPTRMQLPLPQAATGFLGEFVAQRKLLAEATAKLDDTIASQVLAKESWIPKDPRAVPTKMVVSIKRDSHLTIRVVLLDGTGYQMADDSYRVPVEWQEISASDPPLPDKSIDCSDATQHTLDAIKVAMKPFDPEMVIKLPPDLLAKVYEPDRYDPLALLPTDMIVSLAKALKAPNLVAVVPDRLLPQRYQSTERITVAGARIALQMKCGMKIDVRDGCMTVSYGWPTYQRTLRTDRRALRNLFAAYRPQSLLTLDDAAAFAISEGDRECPFGPLLLEVYPDPKIGRYLLLNSATAFDLRLYGSLTNAQKAALWDGRSVPVANMLPDQIAELAYRVYKDAHSIYVRPEPGTPLARVPEALQDEPTEVLPDGIPRETTIAMRIFKQQDGLLPIGPATLVAWGPSEVASGLFALEQPVVNPYWVRNPPPKLFIPGRTFELYFTASFSPGVSQSWQMFDRRWDRASGGATLSELPPAFQQEVQAELEALRRKQ